MDPITIGYISGIATNLTQHILAGASKKIRNKIYGPEDKQAINRCVKIALVGTLTEISKVLPDKEVKHLKEVLKSFFDNLDVGRELAGILVGKQLDMEKMNGLFNEAGYDSDKIPKLPFEHAIHTFETAFIEAIGKEPLLQPVIQIAELRKQSHIQGSLLDEMRELVRTVKSVDNENNNVQAGKTMDDVLYKPEIVRPIPFVDPSEIIQPGGAIDLDSKFYIPRRSDDEVFKAISKKRGFVNVRGASQTGKSSLLVRIHAKVRTEIDLRSVFINFQALEENFFETLSTLWKTIITEISCQLGIDEWAPDSWKEKMPHESNILPFLDKYVFLIDPRPLLLCLDEVNQVFTYHVKDAFFKSVRSLFDKGAHDDTCKRVRWILSTSSEPGFFIKDPLGSPFNIGKPVVIKAFNHDETSTLAIRHGLSLKRPDIEKINKYGGSRPYLIHLLLYELAMKEKTLEELLDANSAGGGIFLEHLNHYLKKFQEEPDLRDAMLGVVTDRGCNSVVMSHRLEAAGLALYNEKQKLISSCELYTEFFRGKL